MKDSRALHGRTHDLANVDWDFKTGLLDNTIPVTKLTGPGNAFTVELVAFAPKSADGARRVRALVYGLYLESNTPGRLTGTVLLPELFGDS